MITVRKKKRSLVGFFFIALPARNLFFFSLFDVGRNVAQVRVFAGQRKGRIRQRF